MDKVGEHIVLVGGANQPANGDAHGLGIIGRQDIAEIAGRDAHVDLLPLGNGALLQQITVGGSVVHNLRQHPAPVNRVGRGQEIAPLSQLSRQLFVGEKLFHPGLGIVKIAHHRAYTHVSTLLGHHL